MWFVFILYLKKTIMESKQTLNRLIGAVYKEIEQFLGSMPRHESLSICLTGGRTADVLYNDEKIQSLLKKKFTNYYFGDERCVAANHTDSNYHLALSTLFSGGIPEGIFLHKMRGDVPDADQEAERYAKLLPENLDILLLTVGEDGHIASLFPGHSALNEESRLAIAVCDAPKPPSARITISPAAVRAAKKIIVMATGAQKGYVLAEALNKPKDISHLPVRLTVGATWVLDQSAAEALRDRNYANLHDTRIVVA